MKPPLLKQVALKSMKMSHGVYLAKIIDQQAPECTENWKSVQAKLLFLFPTRENFCLNDIILSAANKLLSNDMHSQNLIADVSSLVHFLVVQ